MLRMMAFICAWCVGIGGGMLRYAEKQEKEIKADIYYESENRRIERTWERELDGETLVWTSDWELVDEGNGNYTYHYEVHEYDLEQNRTEYDVYDLYNDCEYIGTVYGY